MDRSIDLAMQLEELRNVERTRRRRERWDGFFLAGCMVLLALIVVGLLTLLL